MDFAPLKSLFFFNKGVFLSHERTSVYSAVLWLFRSIFHSFSHEVGADRALYPVLRSPASYYFSFSAGFYGVTFATQQLFLVCAG